MTDIRNILVPLDGSRLAELAIPAAVNLARRHGATVRLASVHVPIPVTAAIEAPGLEAGIDETLRVDTATYLAHSAESVTSLGGIGVATELEGSEGSVARSLASHVHETGVDLVAMTTHGRGGLGRLWLGSVAEQFLRLVDVPVLLLRANDPPPEVFHRIVVALDDSDQRDRIWSTALQLFGNDPGTVYSLITVVEPRTAFTERMNLPFDATELDAEEDHGTLAANDLTAIAGRMRAGGATVTTAALTGRGIGRQVAEFASSVEADLVVCGMHSARGLERILLRSVSGKILHNAGRPVLVVPLAERR